MLTMIVLVKRRKEISLSEFTHYWKEDHGPLVLGVAEFMRHVRRYVQHHAPVDADGAGARFSELLDYDGVGELWFDDRAAMVAAFSEPSYLQIIRPDEEKFLDAAGCLSFVGNDVVLFDRSRPADRGPSD